MSASSRESVWRKAAFLGVLVIGSVVVFALGVMVGSNVEPPPEALRSSAPESAPPLLPTAEGIVETGGPEEVELPTGSGTEVSGEEMTFYDRLATGNRAEAPAEPPMTAAKPSQEIPAPAVPGPAVKVATEGKPAAAPVEAPKETAKAVPAAAGQPAAKTERKKGFAIQVMALSRLEAAREEARKLQDAGFEGYVSSRKGKSGILHAVRVGPVATEAEARGIEARLKKEAGYKDAYLVTE